MKPSSILWLILAACLVAGPGRAQAPQQPATALTTLQSIQSANRALIEKQQKTLQTLEQIRATAEQIKVLGKRG